MIPEIQRVTKFLSIEKTNQSESRLLDYANIDPKVEVLGLKITDNEGFGQLPSAAHCRP